MKLKDGCILAGLMPPMWKVLVHADPLWQEHGEELVVVSGLDGAHTPRSAHPFGFALDLRTRCWLKADGTPDHAKARTVATQLQERLGDSYRVLYEEHRPGHEHIHVHFRPIYATFESY